MFRTVKLKQPPRRSLCTLGACSECLSMGTLVKREHHNRLSEVVETLDLVC